MQFNSRRSSVLATNGMVATSQPLAAMAGLQMLMKGGNAVDGAVAAAAALNVVEPMSTGIGGDLFALVWDASDKSIRALNASGRAPAAASLEELRGQGHTYISSLSPYAVTVPGCVDGWDTLIAECGGMPLSEVLAPAIEYATTGYPVSPVIAAAFAAGLPKLTRFPSGSELLLDGRAPRMGEVIRLPELGRSLEAIAEGGRDAFYLGESARRIAAYVQERGGWLTKEDFASHTSTWDEPISTTYRDDVTCWECPPNGQGINALMALNIAEGFDLPGMGFQSTATYHHLIESMRLAFADGFRYVADPRRVDVPIDGMLSKERAKSRRDLISSDRAMASMGYDSSLGGSDTVYVTCVDGQGNGCSLINSLFHGFGTGLVAPGTGIALQNRGSNFFLEPDHPNALAPGKRPFHTIIPGMATRGGELWLSYGVMGGFHQAQGHLQVITSMVDFGLDPQSALDARRFNVNLDDTTTLEQDVPRKALEGLRSMGHRITPESGGAGVFFGGGQIIQRDAESGVLTGGSDPRKDGGAVGW